jgi:hypothetical protein
VKKNTAAFGSEPATIKERIVDWFGIIGKEQRKHNSEI